jgi:spore germination protein YaaH
VWGYIPNFDRAAAWAAAEMHRQSLTGISLFQYHLDDQGALIAYPDQGAIPAWIAAHGLPVVPVIANSFAGAWQRDAVARVLGDATLRRRHIERIVALAVEGGYPGVEIDYESLSAADREPFSRFIEELAVALHERGKHLAVAVHAKRSEPGEWAGPQAQDWRRIGAAADRIIVLAYDYDPLNPSPIAPLAWAREVLLFAVSQIPPAKVIQGIPLYGYSWSGSAAGVGGTYGELLARARAHGVQPRRDPRDRHLAFAYDADGGTHRVSLVDADTVMALRAIGRDLQLGGSALWRLGGEDTAVWSVLGGGSP